MIVKQIFLVRTLRILRIDNCMENMHTDVRVERVN